MIRTGTEDGYGLDDLFIVDPFDGAETNEYTMPLIHYHGQVVLLNWNFYLSLHQEKKRTDLREIRRREV